LWKSSLFRPVPVLKPESLYDTLSAPWFINFLVFVFTPLALLRLITPAYPATYAAWPNHYPYPAAMQRPLIDLAPLERLVGEWLPPWPLEQQGHLGWYRQGLREVREHRDLIERLALEDDMTIILAAALANQGNSTQRPFGVEPLERLQIWLGERFTGPQPAWEMAHFYWKVWFKEPSVGLGQITPQEAAALGYDLETVYLLQDEISILLMHDKLTTLQQQAAELGLSPTETVILLLIGNNMGLGTVEIYQQLGRDMPTFLQHYPAAHRQLIRMVMYVEHLQRRERWPLPTNVDWRDVREVARRPLLTNQ
jgi:hypothetical protein